MPSLNILSAPSACNLNSLKNQVQTSISGTIATAQSSLVQLQSAPKMLMNSAINNAVANSGIPTNANDLIKSLSPDIAKGIVNVGKDAISGLGISAADLSLSKVLPFEIPKIPSFPALGEVGMYLGAGPKFIAEKVAEYKLLVPPYIPNLPMPPSQIIAVAKLIQQLMKTNPSEFLKALLESVQADLLKELNVPSIDSVLDNSGICKIPVLGDIQAGASSLTEFNNAIQDATDSILRSAEQMVTSQQPPPNQTDQTDQNDQTNTNQTTTNQSPPNS